MTLIEIENSLGQVYEQMDGSEEHLAEDEAGIRKTLLKLEEVCYVLRDMTRIGLCSASELEKGSVRTSMEVLAYLLPLLPQQLGDRNFMKDHGVRLPYMCGAMANGIASERLVIAMGEAGLLGSFGAAGLVPSRIEEAIQTIQTSLPEGPYAFNLIHSPAEDAIERAAAELFLKHQVKTVEASAFLDLTPHIVHYRVNGLSQGPGEQIMIGNRVIAKISRSEVAEKFMRPPPERILAKLVQENRISETQARLASRVPMADDITVEADSGGHTDNRPLVSLLPSILSLRDRIQQEQNYSQPIRVGAGGGISTPASALAAFMMGAGYVVTGSVNQGCVEAAASEHTKKLLAQAEMADVSMAPAADMFEMGVQLQVLKRGTLFPMRAQKLYELYRNHESIEEIPLLEKEKLEKQIFRKSLEEVWSETESYFRSRDPHQIERAMNHPKRRMALIFRWYLGLSSRWSNHGEAGRETDYQIWCGPAMGAFNAWVKGSFLEEPSNRRVVDIAENLMQGAAYLFRLQQLKTQGIHLPSSLFHFTPAPYT